MAANKTLVFYDIASNPPVTTMAPNPWKTRYALNFKGADYETNWVNYRDVESTRKNLGVPPCRFFPNGTPFYTLPILKNTSTGELIGDSFDIALYLDKLYPDAPPLFPPSTLGLHKAFNAQVDAIFTPYAVLCTDGMPFLPETKEEEREKFAKRAGLPSWEVMTAGGRGEERVKTFAAFEKGLGELASFYTVGSGPFMGGDKACYADILVGSWLAFVKNGLPSEEWKSVEKWHDGLWVQILRGLEPFATVK